MAEESNQTTTPLNNIQVIHGEIFLPESLVKLTMKIAKSFEITSYDEFSLLDTLQYGLFQYYQLNTELKNEKEFCLLIVNIMRLTDKFNKMNSKLTKVKLDAIFPELQITNKDMNEFEYKVFKAMNFKICTPIIVETIHEVISVHLVNLIDNPEFLLEFSLDILRLAYCWRKEIYDKLTMDLEEKDATTLKNNQQLLASSVILVVLKIINAPELFFDQVFVILSRGSPQIQKYLNELSAIIFNMSKE
ncbi:unnamed protein product [Diamesa serratosioi]